MPHPLPGRSGPAGHKCHHRLGHFLFYEDCSFLFIRAADLPYQDHRLGLGILFEQGQRVNETGAHDLVSTDAETGGLPYSV